MKTFLIFLFVFLVVFTTNYSYADTTMFSKDIGEGFSKDQCEKRNELFGKHFEPIMDLAKLKIETHSAFQESIYDDSYQIISTGLRSSPYSEHCKMDLPSFGIHYATNMTDSSYTRIYVNLERVSYDVHEITTRFIDRPWIDSPKSEPLPFYNTNWNLVHMLGEYHRSDPPIPSQAFKIPYLAVNANVEHIDTQKGSLTADVQSEDWGIFAFKIPRNFPYTDHDDSVHPGHGLDLFVISDGQEEIHVHVTKNDCFYDVWMRFSGNQTLEIPFTISYLQNDPMHGDSDVPEFCLTKTISDERLNYLSTLSPHKQVQEGVFPYHVFCNDGLYLLVKTDDTPACVSPNTASALWDRGWANTSTDIYTTYSSPEIIEEFGFKIKSKQAAQKIAEQFISDTNLALKADTRDPDFSITHSLSYVTSKKQSALSIDQTTGLPTDVLGFDNEGFYRTPGWYFELQKDYLGLPNQRIEDGHLAWEISYRACNLCRDYSTFFVDAITGEVLNTSDLKDLFVPYWDWS